MATPSGTIPNNHAVYGVQLFLSIGIGEARDIYPIVSATIEETLNQISVATVTIPVGLKISKDNEGDINNLIISKLNAGGPSRETAQIIMSGSGKPHPTGVKANPSGDISNYKIFKGYIVAVHNHISVQSVSTTLTIFSEFDDLDTSTLAFGDFAKITPNDWFTESEAASQQIGEQFNFPLAPGKFLKRDDIINLNWWDIYSDGIRYKAERPAHKFITTSTTRLPNQAVLNALRPYKVGGDLWLRDEVKEALKGNDTILDNIGNSFVSVIMGSAGGSSAFEKLVSLAKEFRFAVTHSKYYDIFYLRPYNPINYISFELTDKEFDFGPSSPNPAVVPAALMLYSNKTINPYIKIGNQTTLDQGFVGQYPPAAQVKDRGVAMGPFLVMPVPSWMEEGLIGPYRFDQASKGLIISSAGSNASGQARSNSPPSSSSIVNSGLADAYAEALYFDALFAARTQDIICGYRDDILPGMCIALSFSKNVKNTKIRKRGMVNSVITTFSAGENPTINTIYKLKHVFDEKETLYFGFDFDKGRPHPIFRDLQR